MITYICIVNWRGYIDTIECLESLLYLDGQNFKVIVIDNESSTEGVKKFEGWASSLINVDKTGPLWTTILKSGPRRQKDLAIRTEEERSALLEETTFEIVRVKENIGFAAANNIGIQIALKDKDCQYVWLLNNDTIVDPSALEELLKQVATDKLIGLCGSTLLYYDSPDCVQGIGGSFDIVRGRGFNIGAGCKLADLPDSLDLNGKWNYIIGASMFVSVEFIISVGLMEESYFLYFEELDWTIRNKSRFKLSWGRNSLVYHKEGQSIGTNSRKKSSDLSIYFYNISYLRFLSRFSRSRLPFAFLKIFVAAVIKGITGDSGGLRVRILALRDFLTNVYRRRLP